MLNQKDGQIHKGRCDFSLKQAIDDAESSWGRKSLPICMAWLTGLCFPLSFFQVLISIVPASKLHGQDQVSAKWWCPKLKTEFSARDVFMLSPSKRSFMVKLGQYFNDEILRSEF